MADSLPDYLTCGYCAREFLLDNITLFIAHKTGGCDNSLHPQSADLYHSNDTSTPLTCSTCSRVFMTARGLLHHVQEDHQTVLCLETIPLPLPHQEVRPPPAHSSHHNVELASSRVDRSCRPAGLLSTSIQSEQPTDLSMTCCNSLGKTRVNCSEDKCEITLEPVCNLIPARPGSALPKKRKFTFPQESLGFNDTFNHPVDNHSEYAIDDGSEGNNSKGSFENDVDPKTVKAEDNDVSVCVTAEYQQNTLCCVSLSTEKTDSNKHVKLKRLLEDHTSPKGNEECQNQKEDSLNKTIVYKVPLQTPSDPELAVLKATDTETMEKADIHTKTLTATTPEDQINSSKVYPRSKVFGLTVEQNFDRFIRSSIVSDNYPEELEILSLQPETTTLPCRQLTDRSLCESYTPVPVTPRLIMPGDVSPFPSPTSGHYSSLLEGHCSTNPSITPWNNNTSTLREVPDHPTHPETVTSLSSAMLASIPHGASSIQPHAVTLKNPGTFTRETPSFFDSTALEVYRDFGVVRNNHASLPSRLYDNQLPFDGDNLKLLELKTPSHARKLESETTADGPPRLYHWLNFDGEENTVLSGSDSGNKQRPLSERLDPAARDNADQSSFDAQDDQDMDMNKTAKRRRYPTSRPFKCASCDQAFNQRIHLKKHMSKHTGVKPFKCLQCDYSTVERSHLKVHYRIHTGEKPYICMFCDYATAQNSTLKIHLKRHHETQAAADLRNLRDKRVQHPISCDDDSWTLQESVFLNRSINTPEIRTGSAAGHLLSTESYTLGAEEIGHGVTPSRSSSPLTATDPGQCSIIYASSVKQVQKTDAVADNMASVYGEDHVIRQLTRTHGISCNNNGPECSIMAVGTDTLMTGDTTLLDIKYSTGPDAENLTCYNYKDSSHIRDIFHTETLEDIPESSFQIYKIKNGCRLQANLEESGTVKNKADMAVKSFAKIKTTTAGKLQTVKPMKSQRNDTEVNVIYTSNVVKRKEHKQITKSKAVIQCEVATIKRDVNLMENSSPGTISAWKLPRSDEENSSLEGRSAGTVSVTIPNKAFVQG